MQRAKLLKFETQEGSFVRYRFNSDETIADKMLLYYLDWSVEKWKLLKKSSMCLASANCSKPSSAPRITSAANPTPNFLLAAKLMSVPPEDCVVFEDSPIGIEAAKAANMSWVHVPGPLER